MTMQGWRAFYNAEERKALLDTYACNGDRRGQNSNFHIYSAIATPRE